MMQPMDPLSQLAMCCGLGSKRRGLKESRNYFYGSPAAQIDPTTGWPIATQCGPVPQPYFLLTQPVIIANNPAANQTNTMTLIQHAQSAPTTNTFPHLSILGAQQSPHRPIQPSIVSSQYAIYNTSTALNPAIANQSSSVYENRAGNLELVQNPYIMNKNPILEAPSQHFERQRVTLSSEIFRKLELIEKQVDLTLDMAFVERHGIVITRALDPQSLKPYLTESKLRRYHSHFLFSDNFVIRFIEIIKRPGQTLGLYIRTVPFERPQDRSSRDGLVITKIDTDSPVYNSKVLHVGDEILSVNLVDVQGMSIDDIVIIMSIPKRLVLALRIPRDRDQLLSLNLMQQREMQRSSELPRDNILFSYNPRGQTRDEANFRQTAGSDNFRNQDLNMQYTEAQVDELRREISCRMLKSEHDLRHTRPIRVQSALQMSETLVEVAPEERISQDDFNKDPVRRSSISGQWPTHMYEESNMDDSMRLSHEQRSMSHIDRQVAISRSRDEIPAIVRAENTFQEFRLVPELDTIDRINQQSKERSILPDGIQRDSALSTSTMPRRTLPSRPAMISPSSTAIKPIISSIRLGDTPEQSSYFSSSIDAINRELKELRKQRMALSSNEQSVDSTQEAY